MDMFLLQKIGVALVECFKTFCYTSSPQLIMTLLVKNEEGMLEENLRIIRWILSENIRRKVG